MSDTPQETLEQFCNQFENAGSVGFSGVAKAIRAVLAQVEEQGKAWLLLWNQKKQAEAERDALRGKVELWERALPNTAEHIAEIDALRAEVERLRELFVSTCESRDAWIKQCDKAEAEIERLRAEVEEYRAEVEEYRAEVEEYRSEGMVPAGAWSHDLARLEQAEARVRTLEELIVQAAEDEHAMNSGINSIGALLDEAKDIKASAALREEGE